MIRVFANGLVDLSSIPRWIIPKTQKMIFDASLLKPQYYKVWIKSKWSNSGKVAPSPICWYSHHWKGSLWSARLLISLMWMKHTIQLMTMYHRSEWYTGKNECLIYLFSTSVECWWIHTKKHSTISYKQLTRQLTRNRGGSKCTAKQSKISPNINQLNISLLINCWRC